MKRGAGNIMLGEKALSAPRREFKYPPEVNGKARITITDRDMQQLRPGQYLNDTLVNFALRYIQKEGLPGCKQDALLEKVYVFSSFFYTKFTEGTARNVDEAYRMVQKWTKRVDIFKKKFVFVPICAGSHWSLVCIANLDKLPTGEGEVSEERPCIICMDSLERHDFKTIASNIRSYLQKEWAKPPRKDICPDLETLPLVVPNVPIQMNGYDCGVYVIRYFQEICKQWPRCTSGDITNGLKEYFTRDTFTPEDIDGERGKMIKILDGCESRYMAEERKREAPKKREEDDKFPIRRGCTADQERRLRAALIGPLPGPLRRRGLLATTSPHPSTFNGGSGSKRPRSDVDAALGNRKKADYSYDSSEEVEVVQPTVMPTRGGRGCTGLFSDRRQQDKRTAPFSASYSVTSSQVMEAFVESGGQGIKGGIPRGGDQRSTAPAWCRNACSCLLPLSINARQPPLFSVSPSSVVGGHTVRGIQDFPKSNTPVVLETPNLGGTAITEGEEWKRSVRGDVRGTPVRITSYPSLYCTSLRGSSARDGCDSSGQQTSELSEH